MILEYRKDEEGCEVQVILSREEALVLIEDLDNIHCYCEDDYDQTYNMPVLHGMFEEMKPKLEEDQHAQGSEDKRQEEREEGTKETSH